DRFDGELGDERLGPLVGRRLAQAGDPLPGAAAAASRAAARRDQLVHRAMHRHREGIQAERVELGPAQGRPLYRELERLALHVDDGIGQVVGLAVPIPGVVPPVSIGTERAGWLAPAPRPAVLAGPPPRSSGARVTGMRPDPGEDELLVEQ